MTTQENFRKQVIAVSQDLAQEIASQTPDFRLNYILYRRGQRQDEAERVMVKFRGHPCESAARDLLKTAHGTLENSAFLGLATATEKGFLGFHSRTTILGFATLNMDIYNTTEDCLFDLYHITAQALDTYNMINRQNLKSDDPDIILQPKRNQLALARNNLKSDIFSALMMYSTGVNGAVQTLSENRAKKSLVAQTFYRPEDYPFVISTDVMNYSIGNLLNKNDTYLSLLSLSNKIAHSFDKQNLRSWADFSNPAQTMAWNGFTEEQILGSAIYKSTNPFIKATGNLISEITRIKPEIVGEAINAGNPYVDDEINRLNHVRMTEDAFEIAIIHAEEAESHLPLIHIANNQNDALLKGRMLGWCADALQSAAKTFESTMKKGVSPGPAARVEFQSRASHSEWSSLNNLNSHMVNQRRLGNAITFTEVVNWCSSRFDLRPVMDSINMTMNGKDYAHKLSLLNDLPMPNRANAPASAPSHSPMQGMRPQAAPSVGMGIGGGMMGGGSLHAPRTGTISLLEED